MGGAGDDWTNGADFDGGTLWVTGFTENGSRVPVTANAIQPKTKVPGSDGAFFSAFYLGPQDFEMQAPVLPVRLDGNPGQTSFRITPSPFFAGEISLSCQSAEFECDFAPNRIILASEAREVQLTITRRSPTVGANLEWGLLGVMGLFAGFRRKRHHGVLVIVIFTIAAMTGCGLPQTETSTFPQQASSEVRVIATSGNVQHSFTLNVTTPNP